MKTSATVQEPVTGREAVSDPRNPLAALSGFYRALNSRDMELMHQNWDTTDNAAMDNPLGGVNRGWANIRGVYERLFAVAGHYRFEFYDYSLHQYGDIFLAIGTERGEVLSETHERLDLFIRTTHFPLDGYAVAAVSPPRLDR